jgi:hypothetical protein
MSDIAIRVDNLSKRYRISSPVVSPPSSVRGQPDDRRPMTADRQVKVFNGLPSAIVNLMSDIAIRCEGLSKLYRIGPRERFEQRAPLGPPESAQQSIPGQCDTEQKVLTN